jgi:hypothetical protein
LVHEGALRVGPLANAWRLTSVAACLIGVLWTPYLIIDSNVLSEFSMMSSELQKSELMYKQYLNIWAMGSGRVVFSLLSFVSNDVIDDKNLPQTLLRDGVTYERCASGVFFDWILSGDEPVGIEFYLSVATNEDIMQLVSTLAAFADLRLLFTFSVGAKPNSRYLEAMDNDGYMYKSADSLILLAGLDFLSEKSRRRIRISISEQVNDLYG